MVECGYSICKGSPSNANTARDVREGSSRRALYSTIFVAISALTILVIIITVITHLLRPSVDQVYENSEEQVGKNEDFESLKDSHNMTSTAAYERENVFSHETTDALLNGQLINESMGGRNSANTNVVDSGTDTNNDYIPTGRSSITNEYVISPTAETHSKNGGISTPDNHDFDGSDEAGLPLSAEDFFQTVRFHSGNKSNDTVLSLPSRNSSHNNALNTSLPITTTHLPTETIQNHVTTIAPVATTAMEINEEIDSLDSNAMDTSSNDTVLLLPTRNSSHALALSTSVPNSTTPLPTETIQNHVTTNSLVAITMMETNEGIDPSDVDVVDASSDDTVISLPPGNLSHALALSTSLPNSTTPLPTETTQNHVTTNLPVPTTMMETNEVMYPSDTSVVDTNSDNTVLSLPIGNSSHTVNLNSPLSDSTTHLPKDPIQRHTPTNGVDASVATETNEGINSSDTHAIDTSGDNGTLFLPSGES